MRIFHLIFCLAFGFLGAHRFIVRQKMHGLVFLLLSIFTILFIGNPATEYIADISFKALLVLIAIDAITVLLTGRYIAFESNKKVENNDDFSINDIQNWLQSSQVEGTIDGDGDLYASLELSEEVITDKPNKIYLIGSQKLASGGKSETFDFESEVTTNEANWLRSDYLNGVDKDDPNFALNMKLVCHACLDLLTIPVTVKEGKISDFPQKVGNIKVSELSIILEDGDYRLEGRLDGENGFIYGIEASTEEPDDEQSPRAAKVVDDENTAEVYEFLWDVKKGDTVYIQLSSYAKLDGEIAIGFTGKAEVQEPTVYDEDEDLDGDFDRPEVEDVEAQEGDIGLFEFQIKRGLVDEENIDDEEISDLVNELKELCENEEFEKAATLLLPKLSFEFGTDQLDDDPSEFFADLDYIEIACSENNTSVKVGYDGDLVVTISVQFEIPLQAGISTQSLVDYLPDSGAWAAASVSPGWGYAGSDGDNVWFLGIKGKNSSPDSVMNMSALNFSSLGDAPYNWYLNMLRKFKDYDLAEEKFTECIDECLNENGFGGISWKELQAEQIQSLLDHLETLEMFNDPDLEEKVNGPLHSLIINAMVDAEAQRLQEETEKMSENTSNKKNTYSDDFKKEVAEAAQKPEATLASIGEQFSVSPTLVRNWKIKFSEEIDTADQAQEEKIGISVQLVQSWLQNSAAEGTIDNDGDLYVSTETTSETIMDEPAKLYLSGTQKLTAGGKSETSEISDQLTTNETNWLRSDFLKGVGSENTQFSYNLNCDVYGCAERVVVPLKLEKGKVLECPITAGQIGISKLNFVFEDGDFRAEGTITGPNGFIYAAEVLTEEPEEGHVPAVNKTADDEDSAEMYEFLWDVKKGDTVFVVLCAFEKLDGKLSCGFTGEAQIEEPISYDDDDDGDGFDAPEVEDVETNDGDVGLFEFQIKRGLVDEDEIEDEDVQKLVDELKQLCEDENYEEAAKLLLLNLSFEFGPGDLDDDPEMFFSSTEYIEFDCSSENTSVKIGYDDCLIVTISVQFEIPLNGGISTAELAEYLPDSGAWASASASPGWGYAGSDGDNVWFLEIKEKG